MKRCNSLPTFVFLMFSPYSFLYFSSYLLFLFSLLSLNSFYYFWVVIEILMLLIIGLAYTVILRSYSQLIIYFLLQSVSSFVLLVSYIYRLSFLVTVAFILKLSIFPFSFWYVNLIYRLPNFLFFLTSTFHKLPPMLLLKLFVLPISYELLWVSMVFTLLFSGVLMLSLLDFRILLVVSSIGNNSWFLVAQMANLSLFLGYLAVYTFSLFMLLSSFKSTSRFPLGSESPYSMSFWLLRLAGMPPFPLFFFKLAIIFSLCFSSFFNYSMAVFLLFRSFIFMAYLSSLMKYFTFYFSSSVSCVLSY